MPFAFAYFPPRPHLKEQDEKYDTTIMLMFERLSELAHLCAGRSLLAVFADVNDEFGIPPEAAQLGDK